MDEKLKQALKEITKKYASMPKDEFLALMKKNEDGELAYFLNAVWNERLKEKEDV